MSMKDLIQAALLVDGVEEAFPSLKRLLKIKDEQELCKAIDTKWHEWWRANNYPEIYSWTQAVFSILNHCAYYGLNARDYEISREKMALRDQRVNKIVEEAHQGTSAIAINRPFSNFVELAIKYVNPESCLLLGHYMTQALQEENAKLKLELRDAQEESKYESRTSPSDTTLEEKYKKLEEDYKRLADAKARQEEKFENERVMNEAEKEIHASQCQRLREQVSKLQGQLKDKTQIKSTPYLDGSYFKKRGM